MNAPPAKRGRPLDPTKADQILEVAGLFFMSKGLHATSMDDIAHAASMSKLTLYRRFPNKEALFTAVIESKCKGAVPDHLFDVFDQYELAHAVRYFLRAFATFLLDEPAVSMFRMIGSVGGVEPALADLYYRSGPKRIKDSLRKKFTQLKINGQLKVENPDFCVEFLTSSVLGSDMYMKRHLHLTQYFSENEIEVLVETITGNFLTLYGAD
jgi:TetR/AcrR family transcriptional repressor of mexJK operon